jgi:hypothetical protein
MRGSTPRLFLVLVLLVSFAPRDTIAGLRDIQPRPQQAGLLSSVPVRFVGAPYLVIPENPTYDELLVRDDAVQQIAMRTGQLPTVISRMDYANQQPAIWLGTTSRFPELAAALDSTDIAGLGVMTHSEEYQLVVQNGRALVGGADLRGLRWGMMSLMALTSVVMGQVYIDQAYIRDWPDLEKRVATANVTARIDEETNYGSTVIDVGYGSRMNEVECGFSDAGSRSAFPGTIANMRLLTNKIRSHGMTLTMGCDHGETVGDTLWYREGIPIHSTMRMTSSGLVPVPDAEHVPVLNGNFESWTGNRPDNWTMYHDDRFAWVYHDSVVKHSGNSSVKWTGFGPNDPSALDLRQYFYLAPDHLLTIKFWYKLSGFQGLISVCVQGKNEPWNRWNNTWINFPTPTTTDWTQYELPLCTFDSDTAIVLIGPAAVSGTLWLDDLTFETADFKNMLRRSDTPVAIYKQNQTTPLTEGSDYRIVEQNPTSYNRFVVNPRIDQIPGGALAIGDTVRVDWWCAFNYQNCRGTGCYSLIEPLLDFQERVAIVDSIFHPDMFKLQINEVSYTDYDELCTSRHLTPGQIVGKYCQQQYQIIQGRRPGIPVRIYGDAFDILVTDSRAMPVHTAPWTIGALQELSPQIEMMAMDDYSHNLDSSMIYFANNGHPSIVAYNELGTVTFTGAVQATLKAKRHAPSCKGTICYTWPGDCSVATLQQQIPIVGNLSWNMGPYILHTPLEFHSRPDSIVMRAEMWTDIFYAGDTVSLGATTLSYRYLPNGNWTTVPMTGIAADVFGATLRTVPSTATGISYYMTVADSRSDTSTAPADAPGRAFTAIFGSDSSESGGPGGDEIEYSTQTIPDGLLLEWSPQSNTKWYEIHAGANIDFADDSRTLISRQSPQCPRFLLKQGRIQLEDMADVHVYRFTDEPVYKKAGVYVRKR